MSTQLVVNYVNTVTGKREKPHEPLGRENFSYRWCLHCYRAYPAGNWRKEISKSLEGGGYQMCPYEGCGGSVPLDGLAWDNDWIFLEGEIPETGKVYDPYCSKYGDRLYLRNIANLFLEYPDLGKYGWDSKKDAGKPNPDVVCKVMRWIYKNLTTGSSFGKKSSYGWKHLCEKKGMPEGSNNYFVPGIGEYVSNGEFIAAALLCHMEHKIVGVNSLFKMKWSRNREKVLLHQAA